MTGIFRSNGKKWIESTDVYRSDGKKWLKAEFFRSNGKKFDKISEQRHVKTFECTWSQSYGGSGVQKPTWLDSRNVCHQGRYGAPYTDEYDWGIQKSMIGFDHAAIRKELAGARIEKVEVYLRNKHFWYFGGGYAVLGYHNSPSRPDRFQYVVNQIKKEYYTGRGAAKWLEMPTKLGNQLRDGTTKGLILYAPTTILDYYGYFYGAGGGSSKPKIRITYVK